MSALTALAAELREEGSVISAHVVESEAPATLGTLAGAGPASGERAAAYSEIVECVREGYLLHYGKPRLVEPPDPDLALLAGDYLYAKGLERLAALGDLAAVRELSDLISLSAQLHAEGGAEADRAVAALWLASAVAIATGPSEAHQQAKQDLREGGASQAVYQAAADSASTAGIDEQLARAAETVGFPPSHLG